ncbi:hypothetical protein KDK77_02345 [bacterium]|nr:hypothetical protein [bacterium]
MTALLRKFFFKIAMPILGILLEEAMALIIEALKNETLNEKSKVQYVVDGMKVKVDEMKDAI